MDRRRDSARFLKRGLGALFACLLSVAFANPVMGAEMQDSAYSWWVDPVAHVDHDGTQWIGGVSSVGDVLVWRDGVRHVIDNVQADDHNAPAIITAPDRQTLVFYSGHNLSTQLFVKAFGAAERTELTFPGNTTYVQPMVYGDRILLLARATKCKWYTALSDDWGLTWAEPEVFLNGCNFGAQYVLTSPHPTIPWMYRVVAYGHPYNSSWRSLEYGLINLKNGRITVPGQNMVANWATRKRMPLTKGRLSVAYDPPAGIGTRLFSIGTLNGQPVIGYAKWSETGWSKYATARWDSERGWVNAGSLPRTGVPFYAHSNYLGGMTFTGAGDVILSRERKGAYLVERWTAHGNRWVKVRVLVKSTVPLVRPLAVRGGTGVLIQRLDRYETFKDFLITTQETALDQ